MRSNEIDEVVQKMFCIVGNFRFRFGFYATIYMQWLPFFSGKTQLIGLQYVMDGKFDIN